MSTTVGQKQGFRPSRSHGVPDGRLLCEELLKASKRSFRRVKVACSQSSADRIAMGGVNQVLEAQRGVGRVADHFEQIASVREFAAHGQKLPP
ncbi:MAG: hypothetical protein R3B07_29745 [Polyangiaceae bacterium]